MVGHEEAGAEPRQDTAGAGAAEAIAGPHAAGAAPFANAAARCPLCGYACEGDPCARCRGDAHTLADAPEPVRPRRRVWPLDVAHGAASTARGIGHLLHHRAFVGLLTVPIVANAVAFVAYAALLLLLLLPALRDGFADAWPVLDGVRLHHRDDGPFLLLLATALALWPVWFDVVAGPAAAPLVAATERAMAGPGVGVEQRDTVRTFVQRTKARARLFATQILLLPIVWIVALVPVAGLPIVFLYAAATTAIVFLEHPAARRGLDARGHLALLRHNWARALGYGVACQVALLLPFVNLLLLVPACSVAAAGLFFWFDKTPPAELVRRPAAPLP